MTRMSSERIGVLGFLLSVVVGAFLYGFASRGFGWFPASIVEKAYDQARQLVDPPEFTTDRVHEKSGTYIRARRKIQPGQTLIASHWKNSDWLPGLKLVDRQGNVLHEWSIDPVKAFDHKSTPWDVEDLYSQNIHGSYLFPNGDVILNLEYVGTVRIDACSRVEWSLALGGHHSVARASDGTFWVSGRTIRGDAQNLVDLPGVGRPAAQNQVIHVTADGELLKVINILNVILKNNLERYIPKVNPSDTADITHLNDVEPLPTAMANEYPQFRAGDLLVSLRNLHLVLVLDSKNKQVKWYASDDFIEQHDPDFIGDGWIGVFDNRPDGTERGALLGGSRIIAFKPETESRKVLFPTGESEPFYTPWMGKWQLLENGNLLLTESLAGRVAEVAKDGRTVWEWIVEPYSEGKIPEVTEATRYSLPRERIEGWPCSPEVASGDRRKGH